MFENVGEKIRTLAKLLLLVGVLASGIAMIAIWITGGGMSGRGGFTIFVFGLLAGALGCLGTWIASMLTYGFGQLIEDTEALRQHTEDLQYHADALRRMGEERRRSAKQDAQAE